MLRTRLPLLLAISTLVAGRAACAEPSPEPPPLTYELMIDGESFQVEANRMVKLESKQKPGVTYQVAIRVAAAQRLKLDTFQFEYDQRSKVEDSRQPQRRSVKLQHELGFTILITDLGAPLDEASRDKALDILTQSVLKTLRERNAQQGEIATARLPDHQFEGAEGRGTRIRHRDADEVAHSALVYILVGKTFTASCIAQFLDADSDDVLPLVKKTLDSIRMVEEARPEAAKPSPKRG